MSNAGKFHDPIPRVPPAGVTTTLKEEDASRCIHGANDIKGPDTPPHIK